MYSTGKKELKKLRRFLNSNRGWLCLKEYKVGPECEYCVCIFQINYSFKANKKANMESFRKSVMCRTFERLEEIFEDYRTREKWTLYANTNKDIANNLCRCMSVTCKIFKFHASNCRS